LAIEAQKSGFMVPWGDKIVIQIAAEADRQPDRRARSARELREQHELGLGVFVDETEAPITVDQQPDVDLPRFSGEAFAHSAACFSN
jgi:hypothetical protein